MFANNLMCDPLVVLSCPNFNAEFPTGFEFTCGGGGCGDGGGRQHRV